MTTTDLTESERLLLMALLAATEAFAAEPAPPKWKTWAREEYDAEVEHGPRYKPAEWFGDISNARRQRFLRAAYALHARKLLTITESEGGRLQHLKLTDEGHALAKQLPKPATEEPAID